MRRSLSLMLFAAAALPSLAPAQPGSPAIRQLLVQARPDPAPMECEKTAPVARRAAAPNPDPLEVPTVETVRSMSPNADVTMSSGPVVAQPSVPARRPGPGPYRIGIWGDSHLAANFFTEELLRQLKAPEGVTNTIIPATMGRAGVRLPLLRSCVSSQWKYEPNYVGGESAAAPGPGLANMFADQPGATLAWDVRKSAQSPGYERVRILYQQAEAPLVVGVSVDGGAEQEITLAGPAGPAALELMADLPISQVKLRLLDGRLRFHGLELLPQQPAAFGMDVFGYPGATVAGWKATNQDYLASWFARDQYQLVILEFGTNEGNVKPFDLAAYRKTLVESVANMKAMFPSAACVLVAPGDRGVLVPRSANIRKPKTRKEREAQARRKKAAQIDLLQYSRIHAEIGRVQAEVAQSAGCSAWSMLDAMGGQGQAYEWARQSPALMAKDLIHFTVPGYQRLAQAFFKDLGWVPLPPVEAAATESRDNNGLTGGSTVPPGR